MGLADDKLEGFATRNSLTPGKPLSKWNFFVIHQLLGFPENGLIDGKFLYLLHYESKLASSAVGAPVHLIFLFGDRTFDKYRFNLQTPDIRIAAHHKILASEHSVHASIFLLLCVSPIDLRILPGVKQWPPVATP